MAKGKAVEMAQEMDLCYHLLGGSNEPIFNTADAKSEDGDVMLWLREKMSPKNIDGEKAGEPTSQVDKDAEDDILDDHFKAHQDPLDMEVNDTMPLSTRLKAFVGYLGSESVAKEFMATLLWHCAQCTKRAKGLIDGDVLHHLQFLEGPLGIV